jgi:hypothetical protein
MIHDGLIPARVRFAVSFANLVAAMLQAGRVPVADLSEASVLDAARRRTGLEDWGDERFRIPLRKILESQAADASLTHVGRFLARQMLIQRVVNRLEIHRDLRLCPQILDERIRRPLFIVGLPRSGTTLLHNLLAQDPQARPLLFWEAWNPSPPPNPEEYVTDRRIRIAQRRVALLERLLPRLRAIHEIDPRGPAECVGLLTNTFVTPFFQGKLPKYREWLDAASDELVIHAYNEYRQQLQLLQWRVPASHWVLKAPSHLFGLSALLRVFPDACVVQMHRDPIKSLPSLCSLSATLGSLTFKSVDFKTLGAGHIALFELLLTRAMEARRDDGGRVYDVQYQALVNDPAGTVRAIYDHFGYELNEEMGRNMTNYLARNPQHKHGKHHYSLADFDLDREALERRFGDYYRRFQIVPEADGASMPDR